MSENQPTFDEFRAQMEAQYPNTVLIARVPQPGMHGDKLYGPFMNGKEACDWVATLPMNLRVNFVALRNPKVKRGYQEFYAPDGQLNLDVEFSKSVTPNA